MANASYNGWIHDQPRRPRLADLEISVRDEYDSAVVQVEGIVDLESSSALRDLLLQCVAERRNVVVDLDGVSFLGSSGVASLIETRAAAGRCGQRLALVAAGGAAHRALRVADLDRIFSVHATLALALDARPEVTN